jgi:hypothetical protein
VARQGLLRGPPCTPSLVERRAALPHGPRRRPRTDERTCYHRELRALPGASRSAVVQWQLLYRAGSPPRGDCTPSDGGSSRLLAGKRGGSVPGATREPGRLRQLSCGRTGGTPDQALPGGFGHSCRSLRGIVSLHLQRPYEPPVRSLPAMSPSWNSWEHERRRHVKRARELELDDELDERLKKRQKNNDPPGHRAEPSPSRQNRDRLPAARPRRR